MTITGYAFLWHQVRCMAAVLFMIGRGFEDTSVLDRLLDTGACPARPPYAMASERALVLFACGYEDLAWRVDRDALAGVCRDLREMHAEAAVRAAMTRDMLDALSGVVVEGNPAADDAGPVVLWRDIRADVRAKVRP